jgi:hypothetical protein
MLRQTLLLLVISAVALVPLTAAPITFFTSLSGPAEEPPNASLGTGFSVVTIDPVAHTLAVSVTFGGLTGITTASHIHVINGPGDANTADTNGPVATAVPTFPGFPLGVSAGVYQQTFNSTLAPTFNPSFVTAAGGLPAAEAALFAGIQSGRAYLNVHSNVSPGGEIRGFLQPVPEPSTVGFATLGLSALLIARLRGRRQGRN